MANCLLLWAILVIGLVAGACNATIFAVGGIGGWDPSTDLQSWVVNKVFRIGDVLLFQYSRYHNVNEVDSLNYNRCDVQPTLIAIASIAANTYRPSAPLRPRKVLQSPALPLYRWLRRHEVTSERAG
ncbi:uncharacterized protein A4U43_C04F31850 [Asparagus officinalis]|uniref:Phytocyanin domain-containing protein n=1 Tax=Asparagus officinalis TaxID=4686 RepID=A0A5P1F512_ASPOF|nr:uncharacterized protein A4U43_C04F31850 [Asparagus officinalis]